MPTKTQIDSFTRRVISQLPDSFEQQKCDLEVLYAVLPVGTPGRRVAGEMLSAIYLCERKQKEFLFGKEGGGS